MNEGRRRRFCVAKFRQIDGIINNAPIEKQEKKSSVLKALKDINNTINNNDEKEKQVIKSKNEMER